MKTKIVMNGRGSRCCLALFFLVFLCSRESFAGNNLKKIVSLSPSTTEWIFELGLEDQLVGVTEQCDFPPAALKKPKVGSFMQTSLERVLVLRPTDVVSADGIPEVLKRRLISSGIRIHSFSPKRLVDFPDQIDALGQELGVTHRASEVANRFRSLAEETRKRRLKLKAPKREALIFVSVDPVYLVRRETWMSDLIELLGYENAFQEVRVGDPFPRVSLEGLFKLKANHWIGFADKIGSSELIQAKLKFLSARLGLRQQLQLRILPADQIQRPGPRLMDVLRESGESGL